MRAIYTVKSVLNYFNKQGSSVTIAVLYLLTYLLTYMYSKSQLIRVCLFSASCWEMNDKDRGAAAYVFGSRSGLVEDSMENPLWVGNSSTEETTDVAQQALRSGTHTVNSCASNNGEFSAPRYPVAGGSQMHRQRGSEMADSIVPAATTNTQNQRQESAIDANNNPQTTMTDAYIERFTPACPPYPVGPGYYAGGVPFARRGPSVLPDIDLSHRPGSLQEAICMYIDFLMAENEVRTRISECAVASPPPPLDFHREEYYRDVMCRPVNFPTLRFRDWLKRYNVDIEITDPDGQTVSQTTFAPATPMSESSEAQTVTHGGSWSYADEIPTMPVRRQQRLPTTHAGVICHGGGGHSPRPAAVGHPLLQLQSESGAVPVEVLGPSSDRPPVQGSMNFTPPQTATGPLPSSLYQVQPPPDPAACVPLVGGCGYGSLPVEEDDSKEELTTAEMPVSGWPDVTLERPESGSTATTVDSQKFDEDKSDLAFTGSSSDSYFQEGGTSGSDERFDSRCFVSAEQHWTSAAIQTPDANCSVIDVEPTRLDQGHPGNLTQFTAETSPDHAGDPVLDINNRNAYPVVIEPASPSGSCISTGNTATMVQEFAKCFETGGSDGHQLPYEAGSDQELSGDAQLSDAAAPEAGNTTPPSQSTNTASCLDLGSDFEDLLGTQHSEEFDYHLNYGNSISSNLPSRELNETSSREPSRRRSRRTSCPKSVSTRDAGPASKSSRRESTADH